MRASIGRAGGRARASIQLNSIEWAGAPPWARARPCHAAPPHLHTGPRGAARWRRPPGPRGPIVGRARAPTKGSPPLDGPTASINSPGASLIRSGPPPGRSLVCRGPPPGRGGAPPTTSGGAHLWPFSGRPPMRPNRRRTHKGPGGAGAGPAAGRRRARRPRRPQAARSQ